MALRLGKEGEFSKSFEELISCVQSWIQSSPDVVNQELEQLMQEMMQCQAEHNNIRLADILEYELLPKMAK